MSTVKRIVPKAQPMKTAPAKPVEKVPVKSVEEKKIITKQEELQAKIKVLESSDEISNQEAKVRWAQKKARDLKMVTGIFHNKEQEGAPCSFVYSRYKGDSPVKWTFKDGEVRTIPYGVACSINEEGKYITYKMESPAPGMAVMKIAKERYRHTFTKVGFADDLD